MRIVGDNSDGFQNEVQIEKALNFKLYDEINPNLKYFLKDIFRGYNLNGKIIHAIRCGKNVKPDFYLHIDGIPEDIYVSVKKGSGNSIHQESIKQFIQFLKKEKCPEYLINDLLLYHYGDGTTNNTGKIRYKAREFASMNPEVVDRLNKYFSNH